MSGQCGPKKVAVVGAGLIGTRRARVARDHPSTEVALIVDIDERAASRLAGELDCAHGTDWREAAERKNIDIVVAATPNNMLAAVSAAALKGGKHVLCEKPMATTLEDAELVVGLAGRGGILKVGYNIRHHPGVARARELLEAGAVGEPMFARCCYGHGGRPGYEGEWRCDPEVAGGGELLDQGVHIIDLSRWFLGDFDEVYCALATAYWDCAPVEDNVFAILSTPDGRVASFHASWTEWKNRFRFEVFGETGYMVVDGLGGSYGPERLVVGKRNPVRPPPEEETILFEGGDVSWRDEWGEFMGAIEAGREPLAGGRDGVEALRIVEALYSSARTGRAVKLGDTR